MSDSCHASVADVVVWGPVECRVVVWVCDTRTSMRRDILTFPVHESDWRVLDRTSQCFRLSGPGGLHIIEKSSVEKAFFNCI